MRRAVWAQACKVFAGHFVVRSIQSLPWRRCNASWNAVSRLCSRAGPEHRALSLRSVREFVHKLQARLGPSEGSRRSFSDCRTVVASARLASLVTMTAAVTATNAATTAAAIAAAVLTTAATTATATTVAATATAGTTVAVTTVATSTAAVGSLHDRIGLQSLRVC